MGRSHGRVHRDAAAAAVLLTSLLTSLLLVTGTAAAAPPAEPTPQAVPAAAPGPGLTGGGPDQLDEGTGDVRGPLAALAAAVVLAVLVLSQAGGPAPRHERT